VDSVDNSLPKPKWDKFGGVWHYVHGGDTYGTVQKRAKQGLMGRTQQKWLATVGQNTSWHDTAAAGKRMVEKTFERHAGAIF
jgi:hypothetical protein